MITEPDVIGEAMWGSKLRALSMFKTLDQSTFTRWSELITFLPEAYHYIEEFRKTPTLLALAIYKSKTKIEFTATDVELMAAIPHYQLGDIFHIHGDRYMLEYVESLCFNESRTAEYQYPLYKLASGKPLF